MTTLLLFMASAGYCHHQSYHGYPSSWLVRLCIVVSGKKKTKKEGLLGLDFVATVFMAGGK